MKLTAEQEKLFSEWKGSDPYDGFNFKALMARTGRPREEIRRIVREIASVGYLEFMRGCSPRKANLTAPHTSLQMRDTKP